MNLQQQIPQSAPAARRCRQVDVPRLSTHATTTTTRSRAAVTRRAGHNVNRRMHAENPNVKSVPTNRRASADRLTSNQQRLMHLRATQQSSSSSSSDDLSPYLTVLVDMHLLPVLPIPGCRSTTLTIPKMLPRLPERRPEPRQASYYRPKFECWKDCRSRGGYGNGPSGHCQSLCS